MPAMVVGLRGRGEDLKPLLHKLIISNVKLNRRDIDINDIETAKCVKSHNCVTGALARSAEKCQGQGGRVRVQTFRDLAES